MIFSLKIIELESIEKEKKICRNVIKIARQFLPMRLFNLTFLLDQNIEPLRNIYKY